MRLFLKLLLCVIFAYALAAYMVIPANPEIQFWRDANQRRDREIAVQRQSQPDQPILFFTGGSSCAFSIDPKIIEETCGMPAFNLGLPFAAGPKYLLHQALAKARRGDILVVCLEPDALTYPSDFKPSTFSFGLSALDGDFSASIGSPSFGGTLSLREYLNLSRPGPGYVATWIGKALTGRGYRYTGQDLRYHGRIETPISDPSLVPAGTKSVTQICPSGRELLLAFQKAATRKGVRLLYSMPWLLTSESASTHNRAANLAILESIRPLVPVIDDGYQGVATDPRYFADTGMHLSAQGSRLRSKPLAEALHRWLTNRPD